MSQPVLFESTPASGAVFSSDEKHRFRLWRSWSGLTQPAVAFIGLNPSTATATEDDPTIRRCIGFAKRWGFFRFEMLNLWSYRSTDPRRLLEVYPFHPDDDLHIEQCVRSVSRVVFAWGSHRFLGPNLAERATRVRQLIAEIAPHIEVGHLGLNADGQPKHPLYLRNDTTFERLFSSTGGPR